MRLFLALCATILFFGCNLTTTTRQRANSSLFECRFQRGTLRVDIVLRDSMPNKEVNIASVSSLEEWTGRRGDIYKVDNHPMGNFVYYIIEDKTRDTIWTDGFCALYEEWVNTPYEGKSIIDYEHTIYTPMPRRKSTLVIEQRARNGVYTEIQRVDILPNKIKPCGTLLKPTVKCINDAGDPRTSLDFLILADAYMADEEAKFDSMAQSIVAEWLSREPWCRYKDRISFRTAFLPSKTNVVGDCRDKSIKEFSILNSQFGWHGSDRYLITNDVFRQSDYVGNIPADYVIVAVNTETYGGGGVYNEITTFAAHHPLAIELALHEGGHELTRVYGTDKIAAQYKALANVVGTVFEDEEDKAEADGAIARLKAEYPDLTFNIGECVNGNPFELALSLARMGFKVEEIYATLAPENFVFVKKLAELSPSTKLYCNMEPTMLYYDISNSKADITIGKDAGFYCPDIPNVSWNQDTEPLGYQGVRDLMNRVYDSLKEGRK